MERDEAAEHNGIELGMVPAAVRQQWPALVIMTIAALAIAIVYLNIATYKYSIAMVVTPVQSSSTKGLAGQLGGLASLAGVDLPTDGGAASFQLYVEGLTSRPVARELAGNRRLLIGAFPDEWNAAAGRWQEPVGPLSGAGKSLKRLLGIPVYPWRAPDAARLQEFMAEHISVQEKPKKPVVTIGFIDRDPVFGVAFVTAAHAVNDELIRQRALKRTQGYISYLTMKLSTVTLAEHREALAAALSEQEKSRMLASSGMPYAAEAFGPAIASVRPTSPKPLLVLAGALAAGLLLGILVAMLRYRRPPDVDWTHAEDL